MSGSVSSEITVSIYTTRERMQLASYATDFYDDSYVASCGDLASILFVSIVVNKHYDK